MGDAFCTDVILVWQETNFFFTFSDHNPWSPWEYNCLEPLICHVQEIQQIVYELKSDAFIYMAAQVQKSNQKSNWSESCSLQCIQDISKLRWGRIHCMVDQWHLRKLQRVLGWFCILASYKWENQWSASPSHQPAGLRNVPDKSLQWCPNIKFASCSVRVMPKFGMFVRAQSHAGSGAWPGPCKNHDVKHIQTLTKVWQKDGVIVTITVWTSTLCKHNTLDRPCYFLSTYLI